MQKVIALIAALAAIGVGVYYFTAQKVESPEDGSVPLSNAMPVPGEEGVEEMIVTEEGKEPADKGDGAMMKTIIVTVGADGKFTPDLVKIKKGETVKWKNKTDRFIWPASAIHPTHQIYPEFDARRGIAPSEEYSFTFDKAGIWKYHDHLKPSTFGTVEVTE